ncbi:MAG: BolA family transcriptional regulator [Halioglobus sp.]|nr:BolA family transcriptional regulator [Halioglobus sp.]MBP6723547.1 BolA family transcriptional regulator [Halioglobus sp.]
MDAATLRQLLQDHLEECEIHVHGEGNHYDITAIGNVFEGLRPVRKQQLVYGALSDCIADGSVHAVNIRTYTPAEWQALSRA